MISSKNVFPDRLIIFLNLLNTPLGVILPKEKMTFKFHKQYRLPKFDYSSNGAYFITVCTKHREHFFGEILNDEMYFSEIGIFAVDVLQSIKSKLDYIEIHGFVVMPNHIHILAVITNEEEGKERSLLMGIHPLVSKSISSFTNHFKGKIKRWCNENGFEFFEWQARFNDRIIRDREEFDAKMKYIENNVKNWMNDHDNRENPNFRS